MLPHKNIHFAKLLRSNQTPQELKVWQALRASRLMSFKFRRQVPIGEFIVDFVCFDQKLIIEIDGGQHADNLKDIVRDATLKKLGFRVLRFWNNEVDQNFDGVMDLVLRQLQNPTPHPDSLPIGERGQA